MTEHPDYRLDDLKAERARLSVAIAERQRQIDAAEMQQWCEGRSRRTPEADTSVTKSAIPVSVSHSIALSTLSKEKQAMSHDMSAEWRAYIDAADKRWLEASMAAIGEVLIEERKQMRAEFESRLEAEVLKLRNEFLQDRLDAERGAKRFKVVSPDALIA